MASNPIYGNPILTAPTVRINPTNPFEPKKSGALASKMNSSEVIPVPCCPGGKAFIKKVTVPSAMTGGTVSFGNYAAGQYAVVCCGGCWNWGVGGGYPEDWNKHWGCTILPLGYPITRGIWVNYKLAGAAAEAYLNEPQSSDVTAYSSQALAESAACGSYVVLDHSGGEISMTLYDIYYGDNRDGDVLPTFALYAIGRDGPLNFVSCTCVYSGGGVYNATIRLQNPDSQFYRTANLTFTADHAINVTQISPSNPLSIGPGAIADVYFSWESDGAGLDTFLNGLCEVRGNDAVLYSSLAMAFQPVLIEYASSLVTPSPQISCSGLPIYELKLGLKNTGNCSTIALQAVITVASGATLRAGQYSCSVQASVTSAIGQANPAGVRYGSAYFTFDSGSTSAVFNVALTDGTISFPPIQAALSP